MAGSNGTTTTNGHSHANGYTNGDSSKPATMPLAIVGMACRFAGGVNNPDKLWEFVSQGRSAWSEIPETRFNRAAFHHPQADKFSTSYIKGGYFLEEDVGLFDPSFFNFTADVAASMDPQIRLQLELTFEALESAGIPLQKLVGSKTSVYSGTFTKDYHDRLLTDPLRVPRAFVTGNYAAMLANRISHFFDLKGPSTAVDTGCSTSLMGLHLACQSLRLGESDCAIVGGACINMNPDFFANLSSLGSCGPDGKCYAFDHRVQGYGRGEGVATLIVKRLDDALRDGDPIRVVIRETGVNQDGKTATITSPDGDAQLALIKMCYEKAGLDPLDTAVVEAHGTGTKAGDPIEATAIGRALGEGRPADKPVYIASVKTNLGHTEAASGLAAVIKMSKALEHGQVPPSINFEKPNPDIDFDGLRLKVPQKLEAWPSSAIKRASVNNFGYGGTNTHVILEEAEHYVKQALAAVNGAAAAEREETTQRKLILLSARDEKTVKNMAGNLAEYLKQATDTPFDALAYTLGQRRTRFPWTLAMSAQSVPELVEVLAAGEVKPVQASSVVPRLGFVFNGQGAQWFAMGRELMGTYPVFMETLEECDGYLREFGADWSLITELSRDEKTSRVNEVRFSMPLSSVIQLALVRLLESWGITPTAVTGHSSGEVAAAFAAGALDLREAVASTYFRGLVNAEHIEKSTSTGGMMAVGLGVEGVQPYLDALTSGKVVVACVNSPSSVTLSGDMSGIDELESKFAAESIFARKLKVQSAFHSHYMLPLEAKYRAALDQYMRRGSRSFKEGVTYSSPVTGGILDNADLLGPENWVDNMIKPVLFAQSFRSMVATEKETGLSQNIDAVVEIGPHSALAGPMRQSLSEPALKKLGIAYGSCLERGKHAVLTMQNLAGFLVQRGYPVDVGMVNFPQGQAGLRALPNLPSYPWNHSTRFWAESRMSQEHRFRPHPPHDLLGLRMPGTSDHSPIWRLILRASELPWVRDHIVQSNIVYPGSGYICMAIEAMKQLHSSGDKPITGYLLRDVEISKAMIIPENADGVEVQLFLEPSSERSLVQDWRQFHVYSAPSQGEEWVESAKGMIAVEFGQKPAGSFALKSTSSLDVARGGSAGAAYPKKMNPRDLFKALHAVGVAHGPSFQNLAEIRMADDKAVTTFKIADSAATMPYNYQQPHVIHPITLDAVFQAAYPTLTPEGRKTVGAAVPRAIRSLYISADISSQAGHQLKEYSALLQYNRQGFDVHAAVVSESAQDGSSSPVIELEGMHFQSVGRAEDEDSQGREKLVLINDWQEAFSLNDPSPLRETLKTSAPSEEKAVAQDLARAAYHFVHDALHQLTDEDIANLEWYHKTFYDWMLLLEKQAANNELAPKSSRWANSSEGVKQMLYDRVAVSSVNGELAVRMGKNLVPIMRKQVAPLELMLEGQLLYKFYQHLLHFTRSTAQAGEIVRAIAAENPRAKILEIGAGTGGCTIPVLTALGGEEGAAVAQFEHYDFTDISAGFFQSARDRLAAWGDMISFSTLDIEQDPEKQGFQLGSYDIIIAAQVLHATKNMNNTMTNVRRLLKDGGKLILVETTRDSPDMHLIFGNVPGWWLSEEPERKYSPNMPLESWERILKGTGFTGLDVNVWDCEDTTHQAMSCILSTAIPAAGKQAFEHEVTLVYGDNPPPTEWIKGLMESIVRTTGVTPTLSDLATLNAAGKVCIFLSGLDGSPQAFDEQSFTAIKSLVTSCKGLLWVTKGSALDAPTPENALHVGLLRTARVEDLSKRYVSLDLDPARSAWTAASQDAITKVFQTALDFSKESGTFDTEYAERDSKILVPRMHPDTVENEDFYNSDEKEPEMQKFIQPGRSLRMHVDVPGLLDSIIFRDDPDARLPLPEDWVEIEPKAFGLNFRDVMAAMGQLNEKQEMGVECAGVITRVGPKAAAQGLQVGDRVCALTVHGHFANRARVPWTSVAKIPDHMDYETAASFVIVFVTAYFSLFDAGRAEVGETVLVHAASGGVGQACIILCQWIGLEVFATVSSQEKRDFLKNTYGLADDHIFSSRDPSFAEDVLNATGRKGVDIVINSLAGKLLHESWNVLASHGRFVEIGKKDIHHNKSLEMEPFRRALSFIHVDVVQLADNKGRVIQRILQEVIRLLETKTIRNISPVVSYPLADVARAFRAMQAGKHIGKLVLIPSADDVVKTAPERKLADLSPDATYLIVGGLTGIGQSIAWYLLDHGAKNLLLVSRSAATRADTTKIGKELAATGANVLVKNCDVGNMAQLQSVLAECRAAGLPPIRGVVHGGMVLDDSILERMTYPQWLRAMNPKLDGTRNLDTLFHNPDEIDFFILLSSASGVLGSTSQSNYAAGGTYQDALARHRAAQGLPAVSIDLGIVNSVGFVAETDGVKERLIKSGHRPLEESEVLALVDYAIRTPRRPVRTAQIAAGITGGSLGTAEPRFAGLRRPAGSAGKQTAGGKGGVRREASLHEQMAGASSSDEAAGLVERAVVNKLAEMFVIPVDEIDPAQPLTRYGVDSLVAVELRNWLVPRAQIEMSIFDLLGSSSLTELAGKVVKRSKAVLAVAGA